MAAPDAQWRVLLSNEQRALRLPAAEPRKRIQRLHRRHRGRSGSTLLDMVAVLGVSDVVAHLRAVITFIFGQGGVAIAGVTRGGPRQGVSASRAGNAIPPTDPEAVQPADASIQSAHAWVSETWRKLETHHRSERRLD